MSVSMKVALYHSSLIRWKQESSRVQDSVYYSPRDWDISHGYKTHVSSGESGGSDLTLKPHQTQPCTSTAYRPVPRSTGRFLRTDVRLEPTLSLSLFISLSLYLPLSLSHPLSLFLSRSLSLTPSLSCSLSLSLSLSLTLWPCGSFSLCLPCFTLPWHVHSQLRYHDGGLESWTRNWIVGWAEHVDVCGTDLWAGEFRRVQGALSLSVALCRRPPWVSLTLAAATSCLGTRSMHLRWYCAGTNTHARVCTHWNAHVCTALTHIHARTDMRTSRLPSLTYSWTNAHTHIALFLCSYHFHSVILCMVLCLKNKSHPRVAQEYLISKSIWSAEEKGNKCKLKQKVC